LFISWIIIVKLESFINYPCDDEREAAETCTTLNHLFFVFFIHTVQKKIGRMTRYK